MCFKVIKSVLFIIFFSVLFNAHLIAQERCGITSLSNSYYSSEKFEGWLKKINRNHSRSENEKPYIIPVVVHIIHNGEAVGTGQNISEAKVIEQISILNADFRRTNPDAVNTPAIFEELAADTEISFQLARQDPEGLPTNGITRTIGNSSSYSISDDKLLKSNISWPQEDYLNIYVAELNGFLGWAQFPVANLDGLDGEFDPNAETDGVVMDHAYWGINPNTGGAFESFGRTVTHEVGHFLGLRHIWGDGGCSFDDFCKDTPFAATSTNGCPEEKITCGSRDMIENYMDFTDDECMNMFTICQSNRMQLILENSPRRKTLTTSKALETPEVYSFDLGIRNYSIRSGSSSCSEELFPLATVRNYGTNVITGFEIGLYEDGDLIESFVRNASLSPLSSTTVAFASYAPKKGEDHLFEIRIIAIDGETDQNPENNQKSENILIAEPPNLPYNEDFNVFPFDEWQTLPGSKWEIGTAAFESINDKGLVLPYFDDDEGLGDLDYLISPPFVLDSPNFTSMSFRYAYAQNEGEFTDGLIVAVSTDCGQTFPRFNYLFEKYGGALETTPTLNQEFSPISSGDWKTITFDLARFANNEIKIALIGQNGNGNNIFVDDFQIGSSSLLSLDAAAVESDNISIASCEGVLLPRLEIRNDGLSTINSVEIAVNLDNNTIGILEFENLDINSGGSQTIELPINLSTNVFNTVSFEIRSVNGSEDQNPVNDVFSTNVLTDITQDLIPIREDFEEGERKFKEVSSSGPIEWKVAQINGNNLIYSANFSQTVLGKENWLVSPNLSVFDLLEGSLTFEVAYAQRNSIVDGLRVMLSTNCGVDWSEVLYNKRGALLATLNAPVAEEWFPSESEDWRTEIIDLTSFIQDTFTDEIRVAFVTTNGNGNNIFLDNIQFFDTQKPNLLDNESKMTVFPNPTTGTFFVAMDLPKKESIAIKIIDLSGKLVRQFDLTNVLNQRFEINIPETKGVYFVNARGKNTNVTKRILIGR